MAGGTQQQVGSSRAHLSNVIGLFCFRWTVPATRDRRSASSQLSRSAATALVFGASPPRAVVGSRSVSPQTSLLRV